MYVCMYVYICIYIYFVTVSFTYGGDKIYYETYKKDLSYIV